MGNPRGFLTVARKKGSARAIAERVRDFGEFESLLPEADLRAQASRCMDCGIPFCHWGCPLGNLIPDWNDRVYRGQPGAALEALEATNNFPEVTGRVCPAPCEASCVLSIEGKPVTIKDVERFIGDSLDPSAPLVAKPAARRLGKSVAVVGSGPAGLAAAQQLARQGYNVTVFERDDRPGGLLRYGIPDFKLDKAIIDRRVDQMRREGVMFATGTDVGTRVTGDELRWRFDAIVLALGARRPRDLAVPGRELRGVHLAMDFLTQQNRRNSGLTVTAEPIVATGKRTIILGGGDTGSDCLGTALRQGAACVEQLELLPEPPLERAPQNPWPEWPLVLRTSSSQEEGGRRDFGIMTQAVLGHEGHVRALSVVRVESRSGRLEPVAGSEHEIPCDLLLLAMGFVGPETGLLDQLGLKREARGNIPAQAGQTAVPGVFAAGDAVRGASLVVWAIAEGRRAAEAVDVYLSRKRQ
jgi:glutamate synthase (NADPH/NADH) small chain